MLKLLSLRLLKTLLEVVFVDTGFYWRPASLWLDRLNLALEDY